jgi:hypothetical protein
MSEQHEYEVIARASKAIPPGLKIVPQSTPVVSFGRPHGALAATLGINPSRQEFTTEERQLLGASKKRLTDRSALNALDHKDLSPEEATEVINGCYSYFSPEKNPYKTWFRWMEEFAVRPAGASYFDGTACHLDLVQWATDPVWGTLDDQVKTQLLAEDIDFLRFQLTSYKFKFLLLNGRSVVDQFKSTGLALLEEEIPSPPMRIGSNGCTFYVGHYEQTKVLAWTNNIPSKTRQANRESIADWIKGQT